MSFEATRAATQRSFAVNLVSFDWAPFAGAIVDAVIDAAPPVVTLSFGDPVRHLDRCREAGITTLVQVQNITGLRAAIDSGADAVIVQGTEAGGHTGRRGTLAFVARRSTRLAMSRSWLPAASVAGEASPLSLPWALPDA